MCIVQIAGVISLITCLAIMTQTTNVTNGQADRENCNGIQAVQHSHTSLDNADSQQQNLYNSVTTWISIHLPFPRLSHRPRIIELTRVHNTILTL